MSAGLREAAGVDELVLMCAHAVTNRAMYLYVPTVNDLFTVVSLSMVVM